METRSQYVQRSGAPLVSVVLPAFNAAATLERALASIQAQTFPDWELIAVDDGSADETSSILDDFARRDKRVRILHRSRQGIVSALNAGLEAARGSLICRMDADDESYPTRLARQVEFLEAAAHRDIGLVSCLVEFGGDAATSGGFALHVEWLNSLVSSDAIALNRFVESPLAHPSVMFRAELVARLGGYRAGNFPEDYELWLRWLDAGVRMAKVPAVLLRWNDSPQRLSRTDPRYSPEAFFQLKALWLAPHLRRSLGVELNAPSGRDPEAARRGVLVWGAGRPTRKRAAHLQTHGVRLTGYVDVDLKKVTPALGGVGLPVIAPGTLPSPEEAFVLGYVTKRGAREYIRSQLHARGYTEGRDFLMCA